MLYAAFDSQAVELFELLREQGLEVVEKAFAFLIVVILRLRQLCNHRVLCKDLQSFFQNARTAILAQDGQALKQQLGRAAAQEGCCQCENRPADGALAVLPCAHVYCAEHLQDAQSTSQCPVCGEPFEEQEVVEASSSGAAGKMRLRLSSDQAPSTKMWAVLELVRRVRSAGGPRAKVVVFSQFVSFLDLLEDFLKEEEHDMRISRIDGSVSRFGRETAMAAFNSSAENSPVVMLASLMAAGVGINLLGACNVIICDPW